jgi:hypothetical protein
MPQARRQSASKAPAPTMSSTASSTGAHSPLQARHLNTPQQTNSKLRIHALLEAYEAVIASMIGTLSEDPFRADTMIDLSKRVIQSENDLEEALLEGN